MLNFCNDHWVGLMLGAVCATSILWGVAYWLDDSPHIPELVEIEE